MSTRTCAPTKAANVSGAKPEPPAPGTRIRHPGILKNTVIADGDDDGRPDLYAAGTCNFIAEDPGHESTPVVFRISADWANPPPVINLFGPTGPSRPQHPPGWA